MLSPWLSSRTQNIPPTATEVPGALQGLEGMASTSSILHPGMVPTQGHAATLQQAGQPVECEGAAGQPEAVLELA